jgi:hypothetical protein
MFFGGIDLMAQTKLRGAEGYSGATSSLPFVILYMWRDEMRTYYGKERMWHLWGVFVSHRILMIND